MIRHSKKTLPYGVDICGLGYISETNAYLYRRIAAPCGIIVDVGGILTKASDLGFTEYAINDGAIFLGKIITEEEKNKIDY